MVIKHDGRREEFSKEKLLVGLQRACQKRPVAQQAIEELVEKITDEITNRYEGEVPSMAIGERVMEGLRGLDGVAYVRYASIYREFQEAGDFLEAVKKLETKHDTATLRLPGLAG